jgi:hypothetical protein
MVLGLVASLARMEPTRLKLWLISTLLRIFLLIDRGKSEIIREELTRSITPNMITNLLQHIRRGKHKKQLGLTNSKGTCTKEENTNKLVSFFKRGTHDMWQLTKQRSKITTIKLKISSQHKSGILSSNYTSSLFSLLFIANFLNPIWTEKISTYKPKDPVKIFMDRNFFQTYRTICANKSMSI